MGEAKHGRLIVALTTVGSDADADRVASALVGERLAACVSVAPVRSTYRWKGSVEVESERMLIIKSSRERWPDLRRRVGELSGYELPELIAFDALDGLPAYLDWVAAACSDEDLEPS